MTARKLAGGNGTEAAATFVTSVIQPGAQRLVLVFVGSATAGLFAPAPSIPTISGAGLAWQQVTTSVTGDRRLTCFRSMGEPVSGPLAIDFAGQSQDHCVWTVVEYDDVDTGGVNGADAVVQSRAATGATAGASVTLAPSADAARNPTVGAVLLALSDQPTKAVSAGPGFTEIDEQGVSHTPFGKSTTLQVEESATSSGTVLWSWTGATNSVAIALELKAAPVVAEPPPPPPGPGTTPDPIEALIRRFEPVLTFGPDEEFFPVDAKRFVESAALWSAVNYPDDKNTWSGSPGDPFPRQPLVAGGSLAAVSGESGHYIDDPALRPTDPNRELYLELGGWKDSTEMHVGEVTADSDNSYADRSEIARRYREDLEPSRFWYHAEVFNLARLSVLAAGVDGIAEVSKVFAGYREPLLLCYYFFFPAHVQSVGDGGCDNLEAQEVSSHAGDWQCMAILLDGDGTKQPEGYTPKLFGYTGLPADDGRPSQTDDKSGTAMKVEAYNIGGGAPLTLSTIADHPHLYVAAGTHSLYPTPGTHEVNPYPDSYEPRNCGRNDVIDIKFADPSDVGAALLRALTKMVVSGGFGAFIFGFVAALIESFNIPSVPQPSNPDPVPPDIAGPAGGGAGITARPAGLAIPGIAGTLQDWRCARNVSAGGRTYDFVVDRDKQGFWPHDDGVGGYRGNWGQQVTSLTWRRGGQPFPAFWKMFLLAVESGVTLKQLTV